MKIDNASGPVACGAAGEVYKGAIGGTVTGNAVLLGYTYTKPNGNVTTCSLTGSKSGTTGMNGSFAVPAYTPDNSWGLFSLGASTEFGKVTGYLQGSATAGKGDGDSYGITVGVRVPL
jgi:hypothetical protein